MNELIAPREQRPSMSDDSIDKFSQFHRITGMKNITLSVPDEVYRKARLAAARRETSLSSLVAEMLEEMATGRSKSIHRAMVIDAAFDAVTDFRASDRLTRDQIDDRNFMREFERRLHSPAAKRRP